MPRYRRVKTDSLSILKNGPKSFKGRKVGVLMTDGGNSDLLKALANALDAEGANLEIVAPKITSVTDSKGNKLKVKHKIDGGPSVLFDAVVLLPSADGANLLKEDATTRDFVADAFAHCKFIGYSAEAMPLLQAVNIDEQLDAGCIALNSVGDIDKFIQACRALRQWDREMKIDKV